MMHQKLRFPSHWEWHMLHHRRPEVQGLSRRHKSNSSLRQPPSADASFQPPLHDFGLDYDKAAFLDTHPELRSWLREAEEMAHNHIHVSELSGGQPVMNGTLLFQASEDHTDIAKLHFWLIQDKLVTLHSDLRLSIRLQTDPWKEKLDRCQTAPEALFVIIGCVLEHFHEGLDRFEQRLGQLEETMHEHNRTGLMHLIFERRYDLLHWNHLFIPIREIQGAAKEAFWDVLLESEDYKRMEYKLERISSLLQHYALEIDTLLTMDDAISNFRGNDIMKTLTIFTALFTPATVVGALWGMNFNLLPWTREPWGFATMSIVVIVATLGIYGWLWQKGWTGDLLNARKENGSRGISQHTGSSFGEETALLEHSNDSAPLKSRKFRQTKGKRNKKDSSLTKKRSKKDAPLR